MDPLGKKGIFVGYSDQSKAYIIYIPGFRQIEVNKDVTFDEDVDFSKSKKTHVDEVYEEEQEAPKIVEASKPPIRDDEEEPIPEDHDMEEPQELKETPHEMISTRRRPARARDIIQEAERYGAPEVSKRPRLHSNYVVLMCNFVDEEPTCFE